MIIFVDKSGAICGLMGTNDLSEERIKEILNENEHAILLQEESLPQPPSEDKVYKKFYRNGSFEFVEIQKEPVVHTPSNAEVAQMISDLQVDLIIAGVI